MSPYVHRVDHITRSGRSRGYALNNWLFSNPAMVTCELARSGSRCLAGGKGAQPAASSPLLRRIDESGSPETALMNRRCGLCVVRCVSTFRSAETVCAVVGQEGIDDSRRSRTATESVKQFFGKSSKKLSRFF